MSLDANQRRQASADLEHRAIQLRTQASVSVDALARWLGLGRDEVLAAIDVSAGVDPALVWQVRDGLDVLVRALGLHADPWVVLGDQARTQARHWFTWPDPPPVEHLRTRLRDDRG